MLSNWMPIAAAATSMGSPNCEYWIWLDAIMSMPGYATAAAAAAAAACC